MTWFSKYVNFTVITRQQSAFLKMRKLVQHDRTKYVEVDGHFVKENLKGKSLAYLLLD